MKSAIIILAAGSSSRMGQSKQLLKVGGIPLLTRTILVAKEAGNFPIVVVLGSEEENHKKEIVHLGVEVVCNPGWENGMGSSLKVGLNQVLKKYPGAESIIILVCDQPLLTADHLKKLIVMQSETGKPIVASHYSGVTGVPALFGKIMFSEIAELNHEQGAKKIIQNHRLETVVIEFPEGAIDLDTPDDYREFLKKS